MAITLLNTALVAGLEFSLNKLLALDPNTLKKLNLLAGSVLKIQSTSIPKFNLFIIIKNQGLHLSSHYEGDVNTTISGSANALTSLLLSSTNNQSFHNKELTISGDLELIQALQKILKHLNFDWEFYLSKFIGDIPTQGISDGLDSVKDQLRKNHKSVIENLDEYIHEETKTLPSSVELESFYTSVDKLRLQVDRVEARLTHSLLKEKN